MPSVHTLRYVYTALNHARALAIEARSVDFAITDALVTLERAVQNRATQAELAIEICTGKRACQKRAHDALERLYAETTNQLRPMMWRPDCAELFPGDFLDVAERVRARLRAVQALRQRFAEDEALQAVQRTLDAGVRVYDEAVDAYLLSCARAEYAIRHARIDSQTMRLHLEILKSRLLEKLPEDTPAYFRVKRRLVRTKPATVFRKPELGIDASFA